MTSRHDYVKIHLTITYIPQNQLWRDGLLTNTHTLTLPIEILDIDKLTNFILKNIKEIQDVVQIQDENR